ncbi:MAG: hypothetical protein LBF61_01445 [Azoarcus sp.]|jgi:hypothetical protein|nr:hypothetical protein [Azoarcus sp.]
MTVLVYLTAILSMAVLVFFIGVQSDLIPPLKAMPVIRYFSLIVVSVTLLASGVALLVIGTRKRKVHLYRNGEMLLLSGLILWTFAGLWNIAPGD